MNGSTGAPRVLERFTWFEVEADEPEAEVNVLLKRLDKTWQALLEASGHRKQDLIEIFLQLGRRPKAIFDNGASKETVFLTDGAFCERAHIDRFIESLGWQDRLKTSSVKSLCLPTTLHRISFITKGEGKDVSVIGINARIGRSVTGFMTQMCPWLLNSKSLTVAHGRPPMSLAGKSVLLIGRPGAGKTTLLREMAYALSCTEKTVVVVDKINEIAGDFEVPHACIGEARWMPCGNPEMHPQIMCEAVEYNAPDVVLVDEICTAAEVDSACKIAERGVCIIATVHGNTLADTLNCPIRQMLLGGVQSTTATGMTLPRENTPTKGYVKRTSIPAFDVVVELHQKDRWILHPNVRYAVDTHLRGEPIEAVELRPGLSIATLGYAVDDGLNYRYGSLNQSSRTLSPAPLLGVLGRVSSTANRFDEEDSLNTSEQGGSIFPKASSSRSKSPTRNRGSVDRGRNGNYKDVTPPKKRGYR